jgi:putative salt-induced outer membrane protein
MNKTTLLFAGAALSLLGSTAIAQTLGDSAVDNRIEALNDNITDDFNRSNDQFGNSGRALGYDGSLALQASATSGNTDTASLGLGVNMGYYDGTNGYDITLSYQYSENEGTVDEDSLLYDLEYTRDLSSAFYGFAKLQGTVESIPFDTSDNFLGFGVGYKIYDTRDIQWSVQAGVGYRVADLNAISDLNEGALSLSSNYSNQINETLSITNDTDIIGSESDTVFYNDLGFNVSMTETLALRTSLVTEYHTDPVAGKDDTDNSLGVSLVYNFN